MLAVGWPVPMASQRLGSAPVGGVGVQLGPPAVGDSMEPPLSAPSLYHVTVFN